MQLNSISSQLDKWERAKFGNIPKHIKDLREQIEEARKDECHGSSISEIGVLNAKLEKLIYGRTPMEAT